MKNQRIYPVEESPYYGIYPGRNSNKEPIVGFVGYDETIVLALFDSENNYIGFSKIPWKKPIFDKDIISNWSYEEKMEEEFRLIRENLRQNGFSTFETVNVNKFWVDGFHIGIEDYPSYLEDILESHKKPKDYFISEFPEYEQACKTVGYKMDIGEYNELKDSFESWKESGDFVLYFGNDYHCDETGYIHSS